MKNFGILLLNEIIKDLNNNFDNNYDYFRFGPKQNKQQIKKMVKIILNKLYCIIGKQTILKEEALKRILEKINFFDNYYRGLEYLCGILNDKQSKEILVKIIAYRILGARKVKLPLNKPKYWKQFHQIRKFSSKDKIIKLENSNWKLRFVELNKLGYPIKLYTVLHGVMNQFILKQYQYRNIRIKKEDIVIDAGGCWGDTALFFAEQLSNNGKVFSFEFVPSHLKILYKNLNLNPRLKEKIKVIEQPLWSKSKELVYYSAHGPGTNVFSQKDLKHKKKAETISIDDFVSQNKIKRIDFIKMDIEGSESYALRGAENTLKRFKPKLAISIYHSMDDFINIPKYLDGLNLGYNFYLKHNTIHEEETILFAN